MEEPTVQSSISVKPIQIRDGNDISDILKEAKERVSIAYLFWQDTFDSSEDDELFISGVQWDNDSMTNRENENRVTLTINQLQQYVSRVAGSQKKQVQEIKISPINSTGTSEEDDVLTVGGSAISTSKALEGIVRNIQQQSNATQHYKRAFRHGLSGIGWLRVLTEYSSNDSFDLDIKIESITNRWSVLIDPHAKETDYSDANYCFISERISHDEFRKRYPDKSIGDLHDSQENYWWGTDKTITITEYFRREPKTRKILMLSTGETVYEDEVEEVLDELFAQGITVVRERTVDTYQVIWSKITSNDVLEHERIFHTTTIPIVPVLGREVNTRYKRKYQGLITHAKDAQRMLNYWQSSATERVSLAPKAPYIAEAEAIEGYENVWQTANTKNWSVLPYRKGHTAPRREAPPAMPVAEMQLAESMTRNIQSAIGIYDASLGSKSNETSGRAILARQGEADTGTFEFVDNLANAMRRIGILLVELIPKVYDTERVMRIVNPDGTGDFIELNKQIIDEQSGKSFLINDMTRGKYDVTVTTGNSYATKRIEASQSILEFMKAVPQSAQVASDLVAQNMDFPHSEEIAERLKKTLPANLLTKEEQEQIAKDAPPPQPSPEQILAKAEADKSEADAKMKQSEQEFKIKIEEIKLQTAELNFKTKQIEAGIKIENERISKVDRENKRRDDVARSIADKMKNNQGAE